MIWAVVVLMLIGAVTASTGPWAAVCAAIIGGAAIDIWDRKLAREGKCKVYALHVGLNPFKAEDQMAEDLDEEWSNVDQVPVQPSTPDEWARTARIEALEAGLREVVDLAMLSPMDRERIGESEEAWRLEKICRAAARALADRPAARS